MNLIRIFNEIIKPLFLILLFSFLTILILECYGYKVMNDKFSFDSLFQIESFLITLLITALLVRTALIDQEMKSIREKLNIIFDKYGFYGHLLFDEQIEVRINDFNIFLQKNVESQKSIEEINFDKKKTNAFFEQHVFLKKYRQNHIESVIPLTIIIALVIVISLLLCMLNVEMFFFAFSIIKTSLIITTIYTIYETINGLLYILKNPFNVINE